MNIERLAKRMLSPRASPASRRRLIAVRDRSVGGAAWVRHRLDPGRVRPSLIIAGAQKAGTTFLHHQLELHDDVRSPLTKELHYFDTNYSRGIGWYLGHFPRAGSRELVAIESSPGYVFHPHAVERIAHDLPDAKIVLLLRDPTDRAFSHFLHERRLGFEHESDFDRALELEEQRVAPDLARIVADPTHVGYSWRHHSYFARGHYLPQIRHCHEVLGPDRVLVLKSEDLFADPRSVLATVHDFAGLAPIDTPRLAPNDMAASEADRMTASTEARLRERYTPLNRELADYLGTGSWW